MRNNMKTWTCFYIEHTIKNGEIFKKEPGWAMWHSCFDYLHGCTSEYVVLNQ